MCEGCCASSLVCCPGLMQGIAATAVTLLVSGPGTMASTCVPSIAGCRNGHWDCWQFALVVAAIPGIYPGNHEQESPSEE